jgi:hypothetical protein
MVINKLFTPEVVHEDVANNVSRPAVRAIADGLVKLNNDEALNIG